MKTFEELIEVKRDGRSHTPEEIDRIILGFARGEMPDYQMAAWLMAAYINGLSADETVWITDAMVRSGEILDLTSIEGIKVDKHSTGGVADTTTLIVAPLVAACGVPVAKMSGRGLGHTGGTLDKLEAIPGFRVELAPGEFIEQVRNIGIAVIAQSPKIDPADKLIYALRDVTATVPSVPLIVASIISKKIAGGADAIVLDVKVGSGAFMKSDQEALTLAQELKRVGGALGKKVVCVLTDMDQPLGTSIGNSLEVHEAIEMLSGRGSRELHEVVMSLGAIMMTLGEVASDQDEARALLEDALASGRALDKFAQWIECQGGNPDVARRPELLPQAAYARSVAATQTGYISAFDAESVGRAAMILGAGRVRTDDLIDPGAGIRLHKRKGDHVSVGETIATLFTSDEQLFVSAEQRFLSAVMISEEPVLPGPILIPVD